MDRLFSFKLCSCLVHAFRLPLEEWPKWPKDCNCVLYIHIYIYICIYICIYRCIDILRMQYIYIYYTAVINDNKCTHVHLVHLPRFVISPEHYLSDLTRFLIITRTYHLGGGFTPGRMFLVGRINPKMVENRPTMLINHQSNKDNYHAQYCIKYSNYIYTSYIIYYI